MLYSVHGQESLRSGKWRRSRFLTVSVLIYTPPVQSGPCQRAQKHFSQHLMNTNGRMKIILAGWWGNLNSSREMCRESIVGTSFCGLILKLIMLKNVKKLTNNLDISVNKVGAVMNKRWAVHV